MNAVTPTTPDYAAIKGKQNAAWASGDYAKVGTTLQIVGENLAESMDLAPGARVLDVAAGNGNATLAFARRWCAVTSTDYVASLLERGRLRAEAEALDVTFQVSDAEQLPFDDGAYDGVVSTFGVMFAPDQKKAAGELRRVCASGGRIGLANWTPDSLVGQLFRTIGRYVPPPAGLNSPAQWGDRQWLDAHFAEQGDIVESVTRQFIFRYQSPSHFIDVFRTFYGPVHKAFLALDDDGKKDLEADIRELIAAHDTATDGSMRVPSDYLEVVITRS